MEVLWCKANVSAHIPRICGDILYMDALCIHWDMYTHRYINIYPPVKYVCFSVCVQQQWEYDVQYLYSKNCLSETGVGAGACRSRPGRVWLVTSRLGTGKTITFFYSVCATTTTTSKQYSKSSTWQFYCYFLFFSLLCCPHYEGLRLWDNAPGLQ